MLAPATQQLGSVFSGLHAGGSIPVDILRSGMDDLGKIGYLTRDMAVFSHFISTRFGSKKRTVKDRIYKSYELAELDRTYTVTVASSDTNHQTFGLSNAQAAQIQPEDILYLMKVFATVNSNTLYGGQVNSSNAVPSTPNTPPSMGNNIGAHPQSITFSRNYGFDSNGIFLGEYEQVKVISVGAANSASTGNTSVTVDRCYMGPGNKGQGRVILDRGLVYSSNGILGATTVANFQVGDTILRGSPAFKEGTNAPDGIYKYPEFDENYTQEIKYGISLTKESKLRQTWISEEPLDINRWLTTRRLMRDVEFMYLFGRAGYDTDQANGKQTFLCGGVNEFIPKDKFHRLTYAPGNLSWPELLLMGNEVFSLGGSQEKFCFTGYSMDARLRAMFYNSGIMRIEPALSKEFNVEVNALMVSGGKLNIIPSQIMEEAGFGKRMMVLDFGFPSFVPVSNPGWDMHVDNNEGKGIQERGAQIYKEQVIGMRGLQRRYADYQVEIDFSNVA